MFKKIKRLVKESIDNNMLNWITGDDNIKKVLLEITNTPNFFENLCANSNARNDFDNLKVIKNFVERNIGESQGSGASRIAFDVGEKDEFILKVSYDFMTGNGKFTTEKEIKEFINQGSQLDIFPRIYLADTQSFEWFISEKVFVPNFDQEGIEIINEQIKKNYPITFGNLRNSIEKIMMNTRFNSKNDIDTIMNIYNNAFSLISFEQPNEYFFFFTMLEAYPFDEDKIFDFMETFDNFITGFKRSDLSLTFIDDYEDISIYLLKSLIDADPKLKNLLEAIKSLNIDTTDLGPGNLGISHIDGELKIIDISIWPEDESDSITEAKKRPGNPGYYKGTRKSNKSMEREINKCAKKPRPKSCYKYWSADKQYDKSKKKNENEVIKELVLESFIKHFLTEAKLSKKTKETLKKKAENANMPLGALTSVFRKGLAAWLTGHRQGIPQHQWAMARVNSFIRGGKTRSVDKSEWKKVQNYRKK